MKKIWPFSLSFLLFGGIALTMPFLVLFYQGLNFTGTQIGILVGLSPLLSLVSTPFWTGLADRTHQHRLVMSLALLVAALMTALLPFMQAFLPVLLVGALFNLFYSPVSSFADSATMYMLADQKELYGRIRVGGTFGFGLIAILAGFLVQNYGLKYAFLAAALVYLLALLVSQKLLHNPAKTATVAPLGAATLLKQRRWQLFLSLALAGGLAATITNSYLFSYLKALGAAEGLMGLALTIGTLSEIPTFFFGNWLLKRFKARPLLNLALLITALRLLALAFSTSPFLVLATQLLNGVSFSAMWMAGVSYADENAPAGMSASAQGLFGSTVYGVGGAVGGLLGGVLLERLGGHGLYLFFGVVVLVIVAVVALIERSTPATTPG